MLEVLYEDNHCLALNKPAGLLAQGDATGEPTVLDAAREYLKEKYAKPGNVYRRAGPPARQADLGRDAPGEDEQGRGKALEQFRDGTVGKVYWAVVEGECPADEGEWSDTLRKDEARNVVEVVAPGTLGGRGGGAVVPGAGKVARGKLAGSEADDGTEPSDPRAARVEGAADRGGQEVRGEEDAHGARRQAAGGAARASADVHTSDAAGSDLCDRRGAGRLALASLIAPETGRQYASGIPRPEATTAATDFHDDGSRRSRPPSPSGEGPAVGAVGAFEADDLRLHGGGRRGREWTGFAASAGAGAGTGGGFRVER